MEKILIVDDNEKMRKMLRRHLSRAGYEVAEAADGSGALEEIKTNLPDVVLLDVMMPDMTGFDVCERLRNTPRNELVYLIILTGVATEEHKVQGLDAGADDYVTKPFNVEELLARVRVGLRTVKKKREAVIDPLTKLYNRNFFDSYLAQEVEKAKRYQRELSLIMGDIDRFKQFNDTYGHLVGDRVLTAVSQILRMHCRQSDIAVRWGGEELAVLLPETGREGAETVAERIRQAVEENQFDDIHRITISLGVAELKTDGRDLLSRADDALYKAKEAGRNRVVSSGCS